MDQARFDAFLADVTRICLAANEGSSVALAGAGALRAHFLTSRPTEDVDLFFLQEDVQRAQTFFDNIEDDLRKNGYDVERVRNFPSYALFLVNRGPLSASVDVGSDFRVHEPVKLSVGPVIHKDDAVGNKVAALFSRAKVRDYLDVQAIRDSGAYADEELLRLAAERDLGFNRAIFAKALASMPTFEEASRHTYLDAYGISRDTYSRVRDALATWAERIYAATSHEED